MIAKISQETLAEMIGTTGSRGRFVRHVRRWISHYNGEGLKFPAPC